MIWLLLAQQACKHVPLAPPGIQCRAAERHMVPTEDGAAIHLHRHAASGPPVLVVHGISANHRCLDLTAERSLAVALKASGYDAWLMDLRGHGEAHRDTDGREQRAGWTMDSYGRYDLPAAIEYIQAVSGYSQLGYVGHSMGGMVAAIYNAIYGDEAFAAMVVVATPIDFRDPDPLLRLTRSMIRVSKLIRVVPSPLVARMSVPLRHLPFHADDMLWSADNMNRAARDAMLSSVVSPMTRREMVSLIDILDKEQLPAASALPELQVPLRVIAGRADRVAPADRVVPYHDLAGSSEKDYILAGRANGFSSDYGHLDLVLGDHAAEEIYPRIIEWFSDRW